MGGLFAVASGYADDLKLLTPSVKALKILPIICEQYTDKLDVLFNGSKYLLFIYKCTSMKKLFASMKKLSSFIHYKKYAYVNQIVKQSICT